MEKEAPEVADVSSASAGVAHIATSSGKRASNRMAEAYHFLTQGEVFAGVWFMSLCPGFISE